MKVYPSIVLSKDNYEASYSSWQGRSITLMGEELKVSQNNLPSSYFKSVLLYDTLGIMIGRSDQGSVITTLDGQSSEVYKDISGTIHSDSGRLFAVVKKEYRNVDWHKLVTGMNILDVNSMICLDSKYTWPIWEDVKSIESQAIVIKKAEGSYAISTIETYPATYVLAKAFDVEFEEGFTYRIKQSAFSVGYETIDISKKISKKAKRAHKHGFE
jgi:hypothetical protein